MKNRIGYRRQTIPGRPRW